jgi:predicted ATP-dependent endonuclease of OLD family
MIDFRVNHQGYGPLSPQMEVKIPEGYVVLVGENDVGKTAVLQSVFLHMFNEGKAAEICFIPKYRDFIRQTTETGGTDLGTVNTEVAGILKSQKMRHENYNGVYQKIFAVLLNEFSLVKQASGLEGILREMNLGEYVNGKGGMSMIDGISVSDHGSGLRSLLPVVAALTCENIKTIIIDEPEAGLEAGKQKQLKSLFYEASRQKKNIIVATHSHLLLNGKMVENNLRVEKVEESVEINPLSEESELQDVAFKMLGSSLSDLYLPDNFLLVEGASDQILLEKIFSLLKKQEEKDFVLRIISCNGIQNVQPTQQSMDGVFAPVVAGRSPYANIAVALIDKPDDDNKNSKNISRELRRVLEPSGRYFELSKTSLEEYIPEELYVKASLNKGQEIKRIGETDEYQEKSKIKKEISTKISEFLTTEDVDKLPELKAAVLKAMYK